MTLGFVSKPIHYPLRKIRSCPVLLPSMSEPMSTDSLKKEIFIGSAMAFTSIIMSDQHHHIFTLKEFETNLIYEAVNILTTFKYETNNIINRIYRLKKYKAFFIVISLPFFVRFFVFQLLQYIF